VKPETKVPKNWPDFLQNSSNKEELFALLGRHVLSNSTMPIVTNIGSIFHVSSSHESITSLHNSSYHNFIDEADGRLILHANDMVLHGVEHILICSCDTDVVVLVVSFFHKLRSKGLKNLWIFYGVGQNQKYIPVHQKGEKLGVKKAKVLRGFHAFTGCDTVSAFASKEKQCLECLKCIRRCHCSV